MDANMYDAQADTINVDDIATDSNNRIVMRRIKRNEADADDNYNQLWIQNEHDEYEDDEESTDYCPEGADDMGWLGYFAGKHDHLERLYISSFIPLHQEQALGMCLSHF